MGVRRGPGRGSGEALEGGLEGPIYYSNSKLEIAQLAGPTSTPCSPTSEYFQHLVESRKTRININNMSALDNSWEAPGLVLKMPPNPRIIIPGLVVSLCNAFIH